MFIRCGLALKLRWKEWYKKTKHNGVVLSDAEVRGIQPNLIISSCYQSTWEKFFRFFDVEPRVIQPNLKYDKLKMMDINKIVELCDEKTIGIVGILGNHYNGAYDPISTINSIITDVNLKYGYQIGIHVDAASGGFVEPFRCCSTNFNSNNSHNNNIPEVATLWDFRLENVLSINASGHKFGESSCGIGWIVFRSHQGLGGYVSTDLAYLGGSSCDSMTLNFSRPASSLYSQYYKMLKLGRQGYTFKLQHQFQIASTIRDHLQAMKVGVGVGEVATVPVFEILDSGGELPVVAARVNPQLLKDSQLTLTDYDLQRKLGVKYGW